MDRLIVVDRSPTQSVCGACKVLYGRTCCEFDPNGGPQFPMTYAESARIAKWTNQRIPDSVVFKKISPDDQESLTRNAGSKIGELIINGFGLFLPLTDNYECVYLKGKQCSIASVKPHICAMYPFYKSEGGWGLEGLVGESGKCFAKDSCMGDFEKVLAEFNTSVQNLDNLLVKWDKDIKTHYLHMRKYTGKHE
jgi:Fe-S-cluster containining protein